MSLKLGFEMGKDSDYYTAKETEIEKVYKIEAMREASQVNGNPTQFAAYDTGGKDGITTEPRIDPAAVSASELYEENIGQRGIFSMASFDMFAEGKQIDFKKLLSQNLIAKGLNTLGRIFPNWRLPVEVNAYEEVCKTDADVIEFNNKLEDGTCGRILAALVNDEQIHLSLKSVCEVTTCFLQMNQQIATVIVENGKDIPGLSEFVGEYFAISEETLKFCEVLHNSLLKARANQRIIEDALRLEDREFRGEFLEKEKYKKALDMLAGIKAAGSPFPHELLTEFKALRQRHEQMLEKLQAQKNKLDKKLKRVKLWRKISNIIFAATFATVLICSVVVVAMEAPPVAAKVAASIPSIPIIPTGMWVNELWTKYEDSIKGQEEVISIMHKNTSLLVPELVNINYSVSNLAAKLSSTIESVDSCVDDPEALLIYIEDIKDNQKCFLNDIKKLLDDVDQCRRGIEQSTTLVLQKMKALDEKQNDHEASKASQKGA